MEWFETDNVKSIRSTAIRFSEKELIPYEVRRKEGRARQDDWMDLIQKGREVGFFSCTVPEEMGGIDLDTLTLVVLISELASGCCDFASAIAAGNLAIGSIVQYLDKDVAQSAVDSIFDESKNSQPAFFSIGFPVGISRSDKPAADFIAFSDPANSAGILIVDPNNGLRLIEPELFGHLRMQAGIINGLPDLNCCRFRIDPGLETGPPVRLKNLSEKIKNIQSRQKLLLAAVQYGNARAAQSMAVEYAKERSQTGRPIIDHQEVRRVLVQSEMFLIAMQSYLLRMAGYKGRTHLNGLDMFGLCFRFVCENAEKICLDAIQTLGGYGYMKDYGLEKRLRDCKALTAIGGDYVDIILGE